MTPAHRNLLFRQIVPCIGLLLLFAVLETWTEMDMVVQRFLYDATHGTWWVTPQAHKELSIWFYRGPKILLALLGIFSLTLFGFSFLRPRLQPLRFPCLFFVLSLLLVPLIIASGKQITNIYCPKELVDFGGKRVYQRLLEPARPENATAPRGKGFPAGHSSGGFALMCLYFIGKTDKARRLGLSTGLVAGWVMGGYQMLRGEHFLSHTLTSMVAAWLLLVVLEAILEKGASGGQGALPLDPSKGAALASCKGRAAP